MNVPLKKRHNYGKINGSTVSLNQPTAKRLLSTYTNYEDSDYDRESDDSSLMIGPATLGQPTKGFRTECGSEHNTQYLGNKGVPTDVRTVGARSVVSSSSSATLASSASNHDSSERNEQETSSSSSDSSGSSHSSDNDENSDAQSASEPLTEDALLQHNSDFEPMSSKERVKFWKVTGEFSEIEDDFDDKKYFSKPIRSERLQKRMYTNPVPDFSTSKKSKRAGKAEKMDKTDKSDKPERVEKSEKPEKADKPEKAKKAVKPEKAEKFEKAEKSRKTDEKPKTSSSAKKTKVDAEKIRKTPNTRKVSSKSQPTNEKKTPEKVSKQSPKTKTPNGNEQKAVEVQPVKLVKPLVNKSIIETWPSEGPSAIKFRISYRKDASNQAGCITVPSASNGIRLNESVGCANCSKHSRLNESVSSTEMPVIVNNKQEEFYKYLGIDTNPPQEKTSPEPSPTDANTLYNQRRSLRVFIQQRQNEFTTKIHEKMSKDDKSPDRRLKSPPSKIGNSTEDLKMSQSPSKEMRTDASAITPQKNGMTDKSSALISSHIKQRHSYEPTSPPDIDSSKSNVLTNGVNKTSQNSLKETENKCDAATAAAVAGQSNSNRAAGEGSSSTGVARPRRIHKRRLLLPSPMMLTEVYKRWYKQCCKQGFVMRQHLRQQAMAKRAKNRQLTSSAPQDATTQRQALDTGLPIENVVRNSVANGHLAISNCEELMNTFSPTSITHSNASTDSAIVINNLNINDAIQPIITCNATDSLQWQHDIRNQIDKSQFRNPLEPKHGAVLAILTNSTSPEDNDIVVVVQESQITYWYSTSKILGMFGVNRSWQRIAGIARNNEDYEVDALYQHRLIDLGMQFPVYVEMRAKESQPDEFRQSILTFVYLNVYYVKPNTDGHPQMVLERVHLDTLKGFANSIHYIALKNAPSVLMTWTEHNANNLTRCGIVKYTLKTPTLDNIEDIFDYSHLQHDINTLFTLNDYHIVGCGDRTVSMWDHRDGNLLIDVEIELPTIGQNIGCYSVGVDVPDYMLLIQLASCVESEGCDTQLKVMAVQTIKPYNWRTLQTHNIPSGFGKIRSIFNKDDLLTITFTSGSMLFMNITSPHKIYTRSIKWPIEQKTANKLLNGVMNKPNKMRQLFAQSNGQVVELSDDRIAIKSTWEYFVQKE